MLVMNITKTKENQEGCKRETHHPFSPGIGYYNRAKNGEPQYLDPEDHILLSVPEFNSSCFSSIFVFTLERKQTMLVTLTHPRGWWCNPEDPDWYAKQQESLAAIQRNDLGLTPAETKEIFGMTDRIQTIIRLRQITCVPVYRESRKIECYVKTDDQPTEEVPQIDYYRKPTLKEAMEIHQRIEIVDAQL